MSLHALTSTSCRFQIVFVVMSVPSKHLNLFKVNDRNTKKRCEICSKLKIKAPESFKPFSELDYEVTVKQIY